MTVTYPFQAGSSLKTLEHTDGRQVLGAGVQRVERHCPCLWSLAASVAAAGRRPAAALLDDSNQGGDDRDAHERHGDAQHHGQVLPRQDLLEERELGPSVQEVVIMEGRPIDERDPPRTIPSILLHPAHSAAPDAPLDASEALLALEMNQQSTVGQVLYQPIT